MLETLGANFVDGKSLIILALYNLILNKIVGSSRNICICIFVLLDCFFFFPYLCVPCQRQDGMQLPSTCNAVTSKIYIIYIDIFLHLTWIIIFWNHSFWQRVEIFSRFLFNFYDKLYLLFSWNGRSEWNVTLFFLWRNIWKYITNIDVCCIAVEMQHDMQKWGFVGGCLPKNVLFFVFF